MTPSLPARVARDLADRLRVRRQRPTGTPPASPDDSSGALPPDQFVNPVGEGADPHVVRDGNRYLWCQSEGNIGVALWVSDRLSSMGRKHVVWWAPESGPYSKEVWAPEIHRLDGRWYIYLAASDGHNRNHLTYVLESAGDDPLGPYEVRGPLWTGDGSPDGGTNLWSIDLTVLEHGGRRYAIWSGWAEPDLDLQHLYGAEMASPTELVGPRVRLREAGTLLWERTEEKPSSRGLLEAPQLLSRGDRTFLVYSCAASWLPTYKLGMLELTGDDPLDPASWTANDRPAFAGTSKTYGVGHGSYVRTVDGEQWWHVFHAKRDRQPGWQRGLFAQPMRWDDEGVPDLGSPVAAGVGLPVPSGTPLRSVGAAGSWHLAGDDDVGAFDYYGHHQFIAVDSDGVHLGRVPSAPINDYRSGEKLVLRDGRYSDVEVATSFAFVAGAGAAGLLLRTTGPAVGHDAQRGYFAGIVRDQNRATLVLGKTDGHRWTMLGEAPVDLDESGVQRLRVRAVADHIEAAAGQAQVAAHDTDYPHGSVGLRVVDTHACFQSLTVTPTR